MKPKTGSTEANFERFSRLFPQRTLCQSNDHGVSTFRANGQSAIPKVVLHCSFEDEFGGMPKELVGTDASKLEFRAPWVRVVASPQQEQFVNEKCAETER